MNTLPATHERRGHERPRYTLLGTLAKGGMATVSLARVFGSAGFSKLVAVKRLHPELAVDREFVAMLVDEARLASNIRHVNVASTLDLVLDDGFSLVLEYVEGNSLSSLMKSAYDRGEPAAFPQRLAVAVIYGVLRGLDAAHETRSEDGEPLGIVHRDVSPQNVLVGVDGVPRVIDFGVAKAAHRLEQTRPGEVRGKFSYMSPEQLQGKPATRQVDVYAAGVVLWELLCGRKLFGGDDPRSVCAMVIAGEIPPPSAIDPTISPVLDAIVLRATARELRDRYLSAREMLADLDGLEKASDDELGAWVRRLGAEALAQRQKLLAGSAPSAPVPVAALIEDVVRESQRRGSAPAHPGTTHAALVTVTERLPGSKRRRRWIGALLLLASVLVSFALASMARSRRPQGTASASAAAPRYDHLGVPTPLTPSGASLAANGLPSAIDAGVPLGPPVEPVSSGTVPGIVASSTASSRRAPRPPRQPPRPAPPLDPRSYP